MSGTDNRLIVQVKGNQPKLMEAVCRIAQGTAMDQPVSTHELTRNRIERRWVTAFEPDTSLLDSQWDQTIKAVIKVQRKTDIFKTRTQTWKQSEEIAYYVSDHVSPTEDFACAIRNHWGVENRNHYVRDVTLGEDASRIRCKPGNFARLRSFALNILRKNGEQNISLAMFGNALNIDKVMQYQGVS